MTLILQGPRIYTEQSVLSHHQLIITDHFIADITQHTGKQGEILTLPSTWHLLPGFIDLHIHGAMNADVMDATPEALQTLSTALPKEGTTSFLASTMTASIEKINRVVENVAQYPNAIGAEILGIHLEGPFLSREQLGAQQIEGWMAPNVEQLKKWIALAKQMIRVVTLAPEEPGAFDLIRYCVEHNIIAAIGHTNADYATTVEAIRLGATHTTHLFNAMTPFHHRDPGAAGAVLNAKQVSAELIVDGLHLHPATVQLAYAQKGSEKIMLITDAMRAKCLGDGEFELGGALVTVKNKEARLDNGRLAGSVLTLGEAIKRMKETVDCSVTDLMRMTSYNPAKLLNVFSRKGSLAIGKEADIVVLDEELTPRLTICRGEIFYNTL